MHFEVAQYIEINIIGIFLLLLMLFYMERTRQANDSSDQKLFIRLLIGNAVILSMDTAIYLIHGKAAILFALNHTVCVIYYLLHAYFGFIWLYYCIKRLYPEYSLGKVKKLIMAVPCIISGLLSVLSPLTGWIYYLNEDCRYMRGPFMWAVILLSYSYWAVSAVLVVREMIMQQRNREKSLYLTLLLFPVPTIIGNIIQLKYFGLSIIWITSAASLLIIFVDLQSKQLSRDILTGLYNRRQTNKQLAWEIGHNSISYSLYAIMIDVDYFKSINDEFGHVIGDQALISVSEILKNCITGDTFIGRFGGDEFIIIGHVKHRSEITNLIRRINDAIKSYNEAKQAPYVLSLSMGCSVFESSEELTIDNIISVADREMYKEKIKKKVVSQNIEKKILPNEGENV